MKRGKRTVAMVYFDGEKLGRKLKELGVVNSTLSTDLGYHESYMFQALKRGSLPKLAMTVIESRYGITPEDYEFDKPVVEEPEIENVQESAEITTKKTISDLTPEEFSNLVYQAVYTAIVQGWKEI